MGDKGDLSNYKRDILIQHLDGASVPLPIPRKNSSPEQLGPRDPRTHHRALPREPWAWRTTLALLRSRMIAADPKSEMHTVITEAGRAALAKILADYVETLVLVGQADLIPASFRALLLEAPREPALRATRALEPAE